MKAAVLTTAGFEIQEAPKPSIADHEVLVKTLACGVCSGDVFVYQNRARYAATYNRLGHEASGLVMAVGRSVDDFKVGDTVTALALPAYADYFAASQDMLVKLPSNVDPLYALGEAIACCVHAANRFGIRPGDRAAVVGCGFMGLVCLQLVKYQGAGLVCAIDPVAERRQMGERMGADVTYDPSRHNSTEILANHGEFDVVIEAAGVQSAVDLCTDLVTEHGRIILVGYHQSNNGLRTVNMERWNYKAIDVINGHVRRQDEKVAAMRQGIELMSQGQIVTEPLVTIYEFADTEQAFRDLTAGKPGLFKAVLNMTAS
ncbi:MAG: zinc-binding dehydrogenase [Ardenticatenaceae bacterium]|nr:zinc-binding dehydrogenase [Ardenticatenaceae bacterium]